LPKIEQVFNKKINEVKMYFLFFLIASSALFSMQKKTDTSQPAIEQITPEQIEVQLESAEDEYNRALKMFNPWYTGPLQTPSATHMPRGSGNFQPYFIFTDNYAAFDKRRKSISLPNSQWNFQQANTLQTGLTDSLDIILGWSESINWQQSKVGGGYGDTGVTLGFMIQNQTPYIPGVKFSVKQTFPTGKYKNLSTDGLGLNSTGGGAYATQFSLATSKLLFWSTPHPLNTRLFCSYQISTDTHVSNFNSYGGGFNTKGKVRPGHVLTADLGLELSINQNWVIANDVVYQAFNSTKFHGTPGTTTKNGSTLASTGKGYSDQLSLSPAIEYNWNENVGLIAGVQFTVYGRNSSNFVSGQISVSWSFP